MREEEGLYYIGNKQATIDDNNVMIDDEIFKGTRILWELFMSKNVDDNIFTRKDYEKYAKMMLKTNVLYHNNFLEGLYPKSSRSESGYDNLALFGAIGKSMREREFLLFRAILTR